MIDLLFALLGLIDARNWKKFEEVALSNCETFRAISRAISKCEEFNGMTLLHACVRYNPPISVLQEMIVYYPQALTKADCVGRTPLHVAAGCGASPAIIKLLTQSYPEACEIQDEDGRTPLHFACDTSCELFEDDEYMPRGPPTVETVRVLLSGSLLAVTFEDIDEMNALEYAIISDAPIAIVKLLQKAAQKVMKKSSKMNSPAEKEAYEASPSIIKAG